MAFDLSLHHFTRRFILVLGDEGAVLVHVVRGGVRNAWFVPADSEEGPEAFSEFFATDRAATLFVEVDTVEQLYREETLPKANILDHAKVLARRLSIAFPSEELRAAVPLKGKDKASRKYLFTALPLSPWLKRWAALIEKLPNPTIAFCLLPIESQAMVRALAPASGPAKPGDRHWRMLVTLQVTGGFRQIVELNEQLILTRMTQRSAEDVEPADLAASIEREFKSSISYLKRLGFQDSDPFDLVILIGADTHDAVRARAFDTSSLTVLTPFEAGQRLGFKRSADPESPYSDVLHALWLSRKMAMPLRLATPTIQRQFYMAQTRRFAPITVGALTLAQLMYAGSVGQEIWDSMDLRANRQTDLNAVRQQHERQLGELKKLPVSIEEMRATVQANAALDKRALALGPIWSGLDRALGTEARLVRYNIEVEGDKPGDAPAAGRPARPQPPRPGAPAAAPADGPPHKLGLTAEFPNAIGQPALALDQARSLGDRLTAALPGYKIEIGRLPVSVLPGQTFTGSQGGASREEQRRQASADYLVRKGSP